MPPVTPPEQRWRRTLHEWGWRGSPAATAASKAAKAASASPLAHAASISRRACCPGLGV